MKIVPSDKRATRHSIRAFAFVVLLSLCSCRPTDETGRVADDAKLLARKGNHDEVARQCREVVRQSREVILYEGLPHPNRLREEREQFLREKETKKTRAIKGEFFYDPPLSLGIEDAKALTALFIATDLSFPGGYKTCGQFHPDYAIEWKSPSGSIFGLVCFGCGEIKVYSENSDLYCGLPDFADKRYQKILSKYQKQRPPVKMAEETYPTSTTTR